MTSYDANSLAKNGGPIDISKEWAKMLLRRMGLVKRQGTTKAKVNPLDFEILKKQYLADIRTKVYMEDIPADLIINWDHTGLKYIPVSNWTMEPPQVIYAGKTPACLPKIKFLDGWNVTFTPNHWSNEETMMVFLHLILIPYVEKTCADLQLSRMHRALVVFDHFKHRQPQTFSPH